MADRDPELASRASLGQLPILPWRGGSKGSLRVRSLGPACIWRCFRACAGALDLDLADEITHPCSASGMSVTFTCDSKKFAER